MKKVKEILKTWEENASEPVTDHEIGIHLTLRDAARVHALNELFPGCSQEQIINDLLSAALDEIEESFPYIKGTKVIAEDEFGDPVYEDIGPTPAFQSATQKYYDELEQARKKSKS